MTNRPVRGKTYTFADVCKLDLDDAPCLDVSINGRMYPIQTSHVNEETLMKNCPDFAKSLWRYQYTAIEWIPVFSFFGTQQELFSLVDHEPLVDPYSDDKDALWVTPKGSPREQFYNKETESED